MGNNNWGRWGAEDERGAANFITPDVVRSAAGLVRLGEVVPLALTIKPNGLPQRATSVPPLHLMDIDGADYAAGARVIGLRSKAAQDYLIMCMHSATHIDALCHCWEGDEIYNGFPQTSTRSTGAHRCGIDKLGPMVTRGVLLDVVEQTGGFLEDARAISAEELEACARAEGVEIRPGDALLIRTGWTERFLAGQYTDGQEPGLSVTAVEWVWRKQLALVGADNTAVEVQPAEDVREAAPMHLALLRDLGVYLLEQMHLAQLAATGVHEFLFIASPLPIKGGTASPLTPVAVL